MTPRTRYLYALTFISGMSVMAVELTASRLMAPYFGTSHYVWTNIIAVILAALAVGYAIGGKISERSPNLKTLLGIVMLASLFLLIIPFIIPFFGTPQFMSLLMAKSPMYAVLLQSFIATTFIFFIPIALLGMVSPFIIKLFSLEEQHMGDISGKVFAIGTIGSFLGTFLPATLTIPAIGSKRTILVFALTLFLTALAGMFLNRTEKIPRQVVLVLVLALIPFTAEMFDGSIKTLTAKNTKILAQTESAYQFIKVTERNDGVRFLSFNESTATQTAYDTTGKNTDGYYKDMAHLPELITKRPFKTLILGLAGGTIARSIKDQYGDQVEITGVEIDPQVIAYGKEFMALGKTENEIQKGREDIKIVIEDARTFLSRTQEKFDLIIADAYTVQLTIPFHLATQEFFRLAQAKLAENGILAMNVNDLSPQGRIIGSIGQTVKSVFGSVGIKHMGTSMNYLLIAPRPTAETNKLELVDYDPKQGQILTDDRAPIEQMADSLIWRYYRGEQE